MLTLLPHRTSYCCHTSPSTLQDNEVCTTLGNSVAQHPNIWHKSLVIITSIQLESWILNSETVGVQDKTSMQIIIVNPKHCVSHILKACFRDIQRLLNKQSLIFKENPIQCVTKLPQVSDWQQVWFVWEGCISLLRYAKCVRLLLGYKMWKKDNYLSFKEKGFFFFS